MVRFRCKASGNFVTFLDEQSIEAMRREEGYEEVVEVIEQVKQEAPKEQPLAPSKRGRPAKR